MKRGISQTTLGSQSSQIVLKKRKNESAESKRKRALNRLYSLPLTGFPVKKTVHLRYAQEVNLNAAISSLAIQTFVANGMYDPDFTGTGHQPSGFDQNMAFYDHYTVTHARCRVRMANVTTSNVAPAYFDVCLTDNSATFSGMAVESFLESRFAHGDTMKSVGTERNYFGYDPWREVHFDAKKFFTTKDIIGDANYQGNTSANPTEQAFFHVVVASPGATDPANITLLCVIDYIAVLTEPTNIAAS